MLSSVWTSLCIGSSSVSIKLGNIVFTSSILSSATLQGYVPVIPETTTTWHHPPGLPFVLGHPRSRQSREPSSLPLRFYLPPANEVFIFDCTARRVGTESCFCLCSGFLSFLMVVAACGARLPNLASPEAAPDAWGVCFIWAGRAVQDVPPRPCVGQPTFPV